MIKVLIQQLVCETRLRKALIVTFSILAVSSMCEAREVSVKSGETIAFLGNSITQEGAASYGGYVWLVIHGLRANGINVKDPIKAGISGHKSDQMLERLDRDVIGKKPDWMALSCGVNDVWHGKNGVPLDKYKANITEIVDKAQAAGIKVMVLTATMIGEDPATPNNATLAAYNDFLRKLAVERNCLLADLNTDMQKEIKAAGGSKLGKGVLTRDGVHMNVPGNMMMARGVLRSFGLGNEQLKKSEDYWMTMHDACPVYVLIHMSIPEYLQLKAISDKDYGPYDEFKRMNAMLSDMLKEQMRERLKSAGKALNREQK